MRKKTFCSALAHAGAYLVSMAVLLGLRHLGDAAKIALMSVTVFFQVLVSVRDAAACVPRESILAARSLGACRAVIRGRPPLRPWGC